VALVARHDLPPSARTAVREPSPGLARVVGSLRACIRRPAPTCRAAGRPYSIRAAGRCPWARGAATRVAHDRCGVP
jgi:hypothetical protein